MYTALTNGILITEQGVLRGYELLLQGDRIAAIVPMEELCAYAPVIMEDVAGQYVAPGMIDIHSDVIEQMISPRPSCMMDFTMALREGEKQLISQGITTMYHSLSLYKDDVFGTKAIRLMENVSRLAECIRQLQERRHLIRHKFHARYEIDNIDCLPYLLDWIRNGFVQELSIMDHTPGQGQYRDLDIYRRQVAAYGDAPMTEERWQDVMRMHREKRRPPLSELKGLVELALAHNVSVSSHDDDTVEKVNLVHDLGVAISEFPITRAAARRAKELAMLTVAGAPNVLLGGSHSGNLSAAEAVGEGLIDILCSDYYPPAMLHAVFALHEKYGVPLHSAMNLVTANPARAMGIGDEYGSLAPGKKADILVLSNVDGYPAVTATYIDGERVLGLRYRAPEAAGHTCAQAEAAL